MYENCEKKNNMKTEKNEWMLFTKTTDEQRFV